MSVGHNFIIKGDSVKNESISKSPQDDGDWRGRSFKDLVDVVDSGEDFY